MPHVQYANLACPWPGCLFRFGLIDFRLELVDQDLYNRGLLAWHGGFGLVGRCPGCHNPVLFRQDGISAASGLIEGAAVLPDDWFTHAALFSQDNGD